MQLPNTLGFLFSIIQMVLYLIYRNAKKDEPMKLEELNSHIINVGKLSRMEPSEPNHATKNGTVTEITIEDPNGKETEEGNLKNIMNSASNV